MPVSDKQNSGCGSGVSKMSDSGLVRWYSGHRHSKPDDLSLTSGMNAHSEGDNLFPQIVL